MDDIFFLAENQSIDLNDLLLRPVALADIDDMFEYANQPNVSNYLTWHPHQSKLETSQTIAHIFMQNPLGKWAIIEQSTQKMIGMFEIKINLNECEATFGYVLNPAFWGRGIMAKVGRKIVELVFENLPIKRIYGVFVTENQQSERVMQKMGLIRHKQYKAKLKQKIVLATEYQITKKQYFESC